MTDQEVLAILSRRHVVVLDELEHARRIAVLLEQQHAWMTASWRRNPDNVASEIDVRGYAIYDGPSA